MAGGNGTNNKVERGGGTVEHGILPELMGYQLRRAQLMFFQHFASRLGERNITPGQLGLLVLVSENPGISQTALARAVGIERSTLGEAVGALERRGLVERRKMVRDRRSHAVSLSPEGTRVLAEIIPLVRRHETDAAANLSPRERQQLLHLLHRLGDHAGS